MSTTSPYRVSRDPEPSPPATRGELVWSSVKGDPAIPYRKLAKPWARTCLDPLTFSYTIVNVAPDFHDGIHDAVLEALRQHLDWSNDKAPSVTFEPHPLTNYRSYVLVTMATPEQYYAVLRARELDTIRLQLPGCGKLLHQRICSYDYSPNVVILALQGVAAGYDSRELHDELGSLLLPLGVRCDSWDVLNDQPGSGIRGQRTGSVVAVGETHRAYFKDALRSLIPSTITYRGQEYPVMVRGGRPRPRGADPASTGAFAGEDRESAIEVGDSDEEGGEANK